MITPRSSLPPEFHHLSLQKTSRDMDLENRSIYLDCLSLKDQELEYYLDNTVTVFDLSECAYLTSEGVKKIPVLAPKIMKLGLRAIPKLNATCFSSIGTLTNLELLDLSQNYFEPEHLHELSVLPNLKMLFLWQCRLIGDKDLKWLKNKKITLLDISYCNQLSNKCLKYLQGVANICLDGLNYITSEGVKQLVDSSQELKSLSLKRCPNVDQTLFASYLDNDHNHPVSKKLVSKKRRRIKKVVKTRDLMRFKIHEKLRTGKK